MYVCVCMYVWMDGRTDGWMDGWMDASGWMDGCMHAWSVSLGDHTMGGGAGIRDPESYMHVYTRVYTYCI